VAAVRDRRRRREAPRPAIPSLADAVGVDGQRGSSSASTEADLEGSVREGDHLAGRSRNEIAVAHDLLARGAAIRALDRAGEPNEGLC